VTTPSGVALGTIQVVAPPPTLQNVFININQFFGPAFVLGSAPGDLFALLVSLDLIPTTLPGLVALDIGNGGSSLFSSAFGIVPANGTLPLAFPPPMMTLPNGLKAYFQAAVLDGATLTLPLGAINVATLIVANL
jgi:hypothetical protein